MLIEDAENFVAGTGATINHGGNQAYYCSETDKIQLPPRNWFIGTATSSAAETYYSTLLHELTHWTSEATRCNRPLGSHSDDPAAYAREELIAELGAAFLCADLDVTDEPRADHAQYIRDWLRELKADKRAIFFAAAKAEKATAYLQDLQKTVNGNMCLIREIMDKDGQCSRDVLIKKIAVSYGYERAVSQIRENAEHFIRTAIRRKIVETVSPRELKIFVRRIGQYDREFLKSQFCASLEKYTWRDREEAIRNFSKWLGFRRMNHVFEQTTRSLIIGLLREKRIEKKDTQVRRSKK